MPGVTLHFVRIGARVGVAFLVAPGVGLKDAEHNISLLSAAYYPSTGLASVCSPLTLSMCTVTSLWTYSSETEREAR